MVNIGKKLRELSQEQGLSNAEVARRAGLDVRRYGHYVTNYRRPDYESLLRICRVLNTTPDELLAVGVIVDQNDQRSLLIKRISSVISRLTLRDLKIVMNTAESCLDVDEYKEKPKKKR